MMWTWISVVILLVGAELNAELEPETTGDSTVEPPTGSRRTTMADTLAERSGSDDPEATKPGALHRLAVAAAALGATYALRAFERGEKG